MGAVVQGSISLQDQQATSLFGSLGTHSCIAGATLWLRDPFFSDRHGRQVLVSAKSRATAASAIRTVIFQLSLEKNVVDKTIKSESPEDTEWSYYDAKGKLHGPFAFSKMVAWGRKDAFGNESLKIQHQELKCWIPLWFLVHTDDVNNGFKMGSDYQEVLMADQDETVQSVNDDRTSGVLQPSLSANIAGFPELSSEGGLEPMDYELSRVPGDVAPDAVRVVTIVDTNVLISHFEFTEKAFMKLLDADNSSDNVQVEALLLVPWVVLNELDKLKDGSRKAQADGARRALRRLRTLTTERDSFVHCQTAAEHTRVIESVKLPDLKEKKLKGDDMILQNCLHYDNALGAYRRSGHAAAVFLLSNDSGLCLRAGVNGVKCFTAQLFPVDPDVLAKEVPPPETTAMETATTTGGYIAAADGPRITIPGALPYDAFASSNKVGSGVVEVPPASGGGGFKDQIVNNNSDSALQMPATSTNNTSPVAAAMPLATNAIPRATATQQQQKILGFSMDELVDMLSYVAGGGTASPEIMEAMAVLQSDPVLLTQFQQQVRARQTGGATAAAQAAPTQPRPSQLSSVPQQQYTQQASQLQELVARQQMMQAQMQSMSMNTAPGAINTRPPMHPAMAAAIRAAASNSPAASPRNAVSSPSYALHAMNQSAPRPPAFLSGMMQQQQQQQGSTMPPLSDDAFFEELSSIIEHCLSAGVKYYRQQDLGDMWKEMLDDNCLPPWKPATVLHIIVSHNTSFWGIISNDGKEDAKRLERAVRGMDNVVRRGGSPDRHSMISAASWLLRLLREMDEASIKPRTEGDAPDPSEVPEFISLGAMRVAVQRGIERVQVLLHQS